MKLSAGTSGRPGKAPGSLSNPSLKRLGYPLSAMGAMSAANASPLLISSFKLLPRFTFLYISCFTVVFPVMKAFLHILPFPAPKIWFLFLSPAPPVNCSSSAMSSGSSQQIPIYKRRAPTFKAAQQHQTALCPQQEFPCNFLLKFVHKNRPWFLGNSQKPWTVRRFLCFTASPVPLQSSQQPLRC